MTEPQQTPAEALETIRQSRTQVADRLAKNAWTYDLVYSSIAAMMVVGQVAPLPFNVMASGGGALFLAVFARRWARRTGVFVSGVTPKRARWVAIGMGVLMLGLMVIAVWAGRQERDWVAIPLGVAAFTVALVGSRLWMRVFRAETQDLT